MTNTQEILDSIYKAYGTDSGILFGIKQKDTVRAIIEFTLTRSAAQWQKSQPIEQEGAMEVLRELVRLKDIKDELEMVEKKDEDQAFVNLYAEYVSGKGIAWKKARKLLSQSPVKDEEAEKWKANYLAEHQRWKELNDLHNDWLLRTKEYIDSTKDEQGQQHGEQVICPTCTSICLKGGEGETHYFIPINRKQ